MLVSGAAYEASFSSVLRFSRTAEMTEDVPHDHETSAPLPKRLARSKVTFYGRGSPPVEQEEKDAKNATTVLLRPVDDASEGT